MRNRAASRKCNWNERTTWVARKCCIYGVFCASFAPEGTLHNVADCLAGRFAVAENRVHLLGDGQLDASFPGQCEKSGSGAHTLGHHAHTRKNFGERAALAKFDADVTVAAERAGAGEHKVTETCQTAERFR